MSIEPILREAMGGRVPAVIVPYELEVALRTESEARGVSMSDVMREILDRRYRAKSRQHYKQGKWEADHG